MNLYGLKNYLKMFYLDANIPVYLCDKKKIIFTEPEQTDMTYPPEKYISFFCGNPEQISYCSTEYGAYFACLRLTDIPEYRLIFGPINEIPFSDNEIHQIYADYVISENNKEMFQEFLWKTPQISRNSFLQKILFVNYCLNQEIRSLRELCPTELSDSETDISEAVYTQKEHFYQNKSYEMSNLILGHVKSGNPQGLLEFTMNDSDIHVGVTAPTALRQLKNNLIMYTTIITRAAIESGLDTDTAFKMSDEYIQACERTQNPQTIYGLLSKVPYVFAEKVAEAQTPVSDDDIIQNSIRFIQHNTNRHITTADVANSAGFSRSYFSSYFKQQLGFSVGAFITRCKLQEAQKLLLYTNKPLSVISTYLCFSSQSHFQTVFKKQFGMTPMQYRKNAGKSPGKL